MERRKFILGTGAASLGGSGLIGTGAFSRVESQRQVRVEAAEDPDAYLGLDECDTLHGDNYVEIDDNGHLEVDIGENPNGGEGVNSNSLTFFDNVFKIRNQGKEKACVWIDADVKYHPDTSLPLIDFYVLDGDDQRSIRGVEQSIGLGVGDSFCVGIRTYTKNLESGDRLLEDDRIVVNADVDPDGEIDCPQLDDPDPDPPDDRQAISWIAFCGGDLDAGDISLEVVDTDEDGDPTEVSWSSTTHVDNVVVFGAARLYNADSGTGGTVQLGDGEEVQWGPRTEQRPPSPCPDDQCGPKFDWNGSFNATGHQDEC